MQVLDYLRQRGITPELKSEGILLRPKEKVTPEIVKFVKQHKEEIKKQLLTTYQGYTYNQLCKKITSILKQYGGFILIKSFYLDEVVALSLPQHFKELTEQGYICYLPSELATLLIKQPQLDELKKMHQAKKVFEARIVLQ